jgi:uncharacterized protein (TIRG00374 family)
LRPHLKALIGIAVSGLLLWWVFRDADLATIAHQLAAADPVLLVATGAILTTGGLVRAVRWRLLLEAGGARTTLYARWASLNIGFMATNLFPARLGEIVRPLALSRMAPVSMATALGTVVLERALDTVVIIVLALVIVLSPAFPAGATVFGKPVGMTLTVSALVACGVLALIALAAFRPRGIVRVAHLWLGRLLGKSGEALARKIDALLSGLLLVRQPAALLKAMLWTVVLWLWMGSAFWTAFGAFGIHLGFPAAMFTECALSLFEALPAGPGFLGTMQAGVLASVHGIFGFGTDVTLSMAVGYYLAGFIPITLLGLYYAWTAGLHLRSMGTAAETALEGAAPEGGSDPGW